MELRKQRYVIAWNFGMSVNPTSDTRRSGVENLLLLNYDVKYCSPTYINYSVINLHRFRPPPGPYFRRFVTAASLAFAARKFPTFTPRPHRYDSETVPCERPGSLSFNYPPSTPANIHKHI